MLHDSPTSSVAVLKLSLYYLGLYYMCIRKLEKECDVHVSTEFVFKVCTLLQSRFTLSLIFIHVL